MAALPHDNMRPIYCALLADFFNRIDPKRNWTSWPAPGSKDTKFGVTIGPEVGHGEAEVYTRVLV